MGTVVSLGSVNVDRVRNCTAAELSALAIRADWLPSPGETVAIAERPARLDTDPGEVVLGGKGANQAVAAARAGIDSILLGAVGSDQDRYGVLESVADAGVDVGAVAVRDAPTGTADIFVDPSGENRILIVEGANATVDPGYVDARLDTIRAADCLLLQNEIPVTTMGDLLSQLADHANRPTVILDPAPADGVEPLLASEAVDFVTPNEVESDQLSAALAASAARVIRTRGPAEVVIGGEETVTIAPPSVDPVDATAAGDVFNGYLAAGLATGTDLDAAVRRATVAASLSTETGGAQPSIPDRDAVRRYGSRFG